MPSKYNNWTGKGKHWDIPDNEIGVSIRRVNENQWFHDQGSFLRWLSDSRAGRDLLRIPKEYGKILSIRKNSLTFDNGFGQKVSDFRVGAKWGNIVRSHWKEVQDAYRIYERERFSVGAWKPSLMPLAPSFQYAYTTSTFYPDPHTETTTCDGRIQNYQGTITQGGWDGNHDDTDGTGVSDSGVDDWETGTRNASNQWAIDRAHTGFDTSGITDTDTISSATFSIYGTVKIDSENDANSFVALVASTPASNTGLSTADFDQFGSTNNPTKYSDDFDITGWSTTGYNNLTVNAAGLAVISKTGVTNFGCREGHDIADDLPGLSNNQGNYARGYTAEQTGTSNDPKLVVIHSAVASASIKDIISAGLLFPR